MTHKKKGSRSYEALSHQLSHENEKVRRGIVVGREREGNAGWVQLRRCEEIAYVAPPNLVHKMCLHRVSNRRPVANNGDTG